MLIPKTEDGSQQVDALLARAYLQQRVRASHSFGKPLPIPAIFLWFPYLALGTIKYSDDPDDGKIH